MELKGLDILIAGQLVTSRTETLEDYLRIRCRTLAVVGLMSAFAAGNQSRCTYYAGGNKIQERALMHLTIRGYWAIAASVLGYVSSFCAALLFLRRRFHLFIGVATFSALAGVVLKKCGLVKKTVYYCLDYYPPPQRGGILLFLHMIFKRVDNFVVKNADFVWDLSPMIRQGRQQYAGVGPDAYKELIVPLGYADGVCRDLPFGRRQRWDLGFVGTLSPNQGLQLVVEAMPELSRKFPGVRIRVIGDGPFAGDLKKIIARLDVARHFVFHGFVQSDEEVYNILSRCMAGIAVWTCKADDNALYADSGKPKLYALLGLPVIITEKAFSARAIRESGAGVSIPYEKDAFISAVEDVISDEAHFERYHANLKRFTPLCRSTAIFDRAFEEMNALYSSCF